MAKFAAKTDVSIGMERGDGVMVYDTSNPGAPVYVAYLNTRNGTTGDRGPEGLTFVSADKSPHGRPLLIVSPIVAVRSAPNPLERKPAPASHALW